MIAFIPLTFVLNNSLSCIFNTWQQIGDKRVIWNISETYRDSKSILQLGYFPGLAMNLGTLSMFYFYPPLTWRVPIIGTGPTQKKNE